MLRNLPAGLFGETYAIVTAIDDSQGNFTTEFFIFMKRPTEALHKGEFTIAGWSFPAELAVVDTDFAIDEGYRQAEIQISLLLEARGLELGRPDAAYLPFDLKDCASPFVSCRMRGMFTEQMKQVKDTTKCAPLARYLSLVEQVSATRRIG
jgi:hypothetical protein